MKAWQPWFGLLSASGLVVMLLREGVLDGLGFFIAASPLAYGAVAWLRHRHDSKRGMRAVDARPPKSAEGLRRR